VILDPVYSEWSKMILEVMTAVVVCHICPKNIVSEEYHHKKSIKWNRGSGGLQRPNRQIIVEQCFCRGSVNLHLNEDSFHCQ
jgi:hypothetical protein